MTDENKALLRVEQTRLLKIIDALSKLDKGKEWESLKEEVYEKSLNAIERQMLNECLSQTINTDKLYKLQGEWVWAKQFTDVDRYVDTLKRQLEQIKKKLLQ